ncbi:MAG TPA: hypothetical protein P5048_02530 [Chlamydiales bacterium]|nr:hypothetical protein [Chlamydiales bacterium]
MVPVASHKKVQAVSSIIFLIGLAVLAFYNSWWPGIMLVLGLSIAARQILKGKIYDTILTLIIFVGAFIIFLKGYEQRFLLPVLFTLGALHIFIREFLAFQDKTEIEKEEEIEADIEEEEDQTKK